VSGAYWDTPAGTEEAKAIEAHIDRITVGAREPPVPDRPARHLRFARILLATDGSPSSDHAVQWTAALAQVYGADVRAVTAVGPHGTYEYYRRARPELLAQEEALAQVTLDRALQNLATRGVTARAQLLHGSPAKEIATAASESRADLVVLGSRGRGRMVRFMLGSTANGVKDLSPVSVLVARTKPPATRLLVPTDGSVASREAAGVAADLRRAWQAEARLLHAVPPPPWGPLHEARAAYAQALHELDLETFHVPGFQLDVQFGRPADRILATARKGRHALILMGSRGISGVRSLVAGSVSNQVAHRSRASVLLIKDPL
jgi:nucleotide-binding universal stress UspA family protein